MASPLKFPWEPRDAGFIAKMADEVSIYITPLHTKNGKPARGTPWHIGASIWDEATRTSSRFGRDTWRERYPTRLAAQRAAEALYVEAVTP